MALINSPECEKEISGEVISCPNCGVPIKSPDLLTASTVSSTQSSSRFSNMSKAKIVFTVVIVIILLVSIPILIAVSNAGHRLSSEERSSILENTESYASISSEIFDIELSSIEIVRHKIFSLSDHSYDLCIYLSGTSDMDPGAKAIMCDLISSGTIVKLRNSITNWATVDKISEIKVFGDLGQIITSDDEDGNKFVAEVWDDGYTIDMIEPD